MILYLDTSAMIKILVDEPDSGAAQAGVRQAEVVSSSQLTYVEAHAALSRIRSVGRITDWQRQSSLSQFHRLWSETVVIPPHSRILERAAGLASKHVLRAYDAVQLSSALAASAKVETVVASWDEDLRQAASAEGLPLLPA